MSFFLVFQISKSNFKLLLKYLDGLKGYQRSKLMDNAREIVEKYSMNSNTTSRLQYKRAKEILSQLSIE